jgi:hypothetical protein
MEVEGRRYGNSRREASPASEGFGSRRASLHRPNPHPDGLLLGANAVRVRVRPNDCARRGDTKPPCRHRFLMGQADCRSGRSGGAWTMVPHPNGHHGPIRP